MCDPNMNVFFLKTKATLNQDLEAAFFLFDILFNRTTAQARWAWQS